MVSLDEYVTGFDEHLSRRDVFMEKMAAIAGAFCAVAGRNIDASITEDELILRFRSRENSDEQAGMAWEQLDSNQNSAISGTE